jgi:NADH:ubiquinone oxidoreductase subunit C
MTEHPSNLAAAASQLVLQRGAGRNVLCRAVAPEALTRAIFARSQHSGTELLVLVCIANHTQDGAQTWSISVSRIASYLKLTKRAVHYALATLKESGELIVAKRGGGVVGPNFYSFAAMFYEGLQ